MKTNLINSLKLKSGAEFQIGTPVTIFPHLNDRHAQLFIGDSCDPVILSLVILFHYFAEFIEVTPDAIEEAMFDGECPSVAGVTGIEPDGHDPDGWPSILLAAGIC